MDKRNETPPKPAQPWFFPGRLTKPRPGCADVRRLSYRFGFRRNLSLVPRLLREVPLFNGLLGGACLNSLILKGVSPAEPHISKRDRGMGIPERAGQNEKEKKHAIMRDLPLHSAVSGDWEAFDCLQGSRATIGRSIALAARTGSKYSRRNTILPFAARRKTT